MSCNNLSNIKLSNSITSIGNFVFSGCESLSSIIIPNGVTTIGYSPFQYCYNLENINIPASVIDGAEEVKSNSGRLNINVDKNNPNYSDIDGVLFSKDKTQLLCYAKDKAQPYYTIPNNTVSIGVGAFWDCSDLAKVKIPNSVTNIGDRAFVGCKIKNIDIPDSVTNIGESAFWQCYYLKKIDLPSGITKISEATFALCYDLKAVGIPKSITTIEPNAFLLLTGLDVYYAGTKEEWVKLNCDLPYATIHYNSTMPKDPDISILNCTNNSVTVDVSNLNGTSGTVVLAVYDDYNETLKFMTSKPAAEMVTFDNVDLKSSIINVMLWNNMNDIKPLAETDGTLVF